MEDAREGEKRKKQVVLDAATCSYDVIVQAARKRQWKVVKWTGERAETAKPKAKKDVETEKEPPKADPKSSLVWIDQCVVRDMLASIQPWMKVNHIPGLYELIARKARLARTIGRMARLFPKEYSFIPKTWVLPDDKNALRQHFDDKGESRRPVICKPDHSCQGRGIFLTNSWAKVEEKCAGGDGGMFQWVVQKYVCAPLLLDGFKHDLRLYVLIASVAPFEAYILTDGLVRLCTTKYEAPTDENLGDRCGHLTNYAINKKSANFQEPGRHDEGTDGQGSKRSLQWLLKFLHETQGEQVAQTVWRKLKLLCLKLLLAVEPQFESEAAQVFPRDDTGGRFAQQARGGRSRCFQVLGVDVMLDARLRPWLIEVNHLPSYRCDAGLDLDIKSRLIEQTLDIVGRDLQPQDRKTYDRIAREQRATFLAKREQQVLESKQKREKAWSSAGPGRGPVNSGADKNAKDREPSKERKEPKEPAKDRPRGVARSSKDEPAEAADAPDEAKDAKPKDKGAASVSTCEGSDHDQHETPRCESPARSAEDSDENHAEKEEDAPKLDLRSTADFEPLWPIQWLVDSTPGMTQGLAAKYERIQEQAHQQYCQQQTRMFVSARTTREREAEQEAEQQRKRELERRKDRPKPNPDWLVRAASARSRREPRPVEPEPPPGAPHCLPEAPSRCRTPTRQQAVPVASVVLAVEPRDQQLRDLALREPPPSQVPPPGRPPSGRRDRPGLAGLGGLGQAAKSTPRLDAKAREGSCPPMRVDAALRRCERSRPNVQMSPGDRSRSHSAPLPPAPPGHVQACLGLAAMPPMVRLPDDEAKLRDDARPGLAPPPRGGRDRDPATTKRVLLRLRTASLGLQ